MIFGPLRLVSLLISLVVIGVPLAAVGLFLLAVLGSPGSCEAEDRPIGVNDLVAASFQLKWDELDATLDSGRSSSAVFSESEATSRARLWVDEDDVPVSDLLICFNEEGGAISGSVDVPLLPNIDVLIRGTLDLTGDHPEPVIHELDVGGLPGPLTNLAKDFINGLIEDETEKIELRHDYGVIFGEGGVAVGGQP